MPTDTLRSPVHSSARNFAVTAIAYSVGVFALFKLSWVEAHVLLPFTQWQGRVAAAALGAPALPIDVTLACSGADAFALCAGAILAYPATWKSRLSGTAIGFALILVLNSIRIGTLGRAAGSPLLFETLHVYVWPATLVLVIAGYVFAWMQMVNARSRVAFSRGATDGAPTSLTFALVTWTVLFVLLFVATSALYLQSGIALAVASFVARRAADALGTIGIGATTAASTLWTSKGGFEVTPECISTPLIPLYFAAVMTYCTQWRWRLLWMAAAVPLFIALGITRLLVVALPAALIGSPLFLIHAFYQLLLAACVVFALAAWRRGVAGWRLAAIGCMAGALSAYALGPVYAAALSVFAIDMPFNDAQGAMASLPSFQTGFYLALSIATMTVVTRAFVTGLGALVAVQVVAVSALLALSRYHGDLVPHIRDVRAWAIIAPLAIVVIGLTSHDRPRL